MAAPESRATTASMPVPTNGASARTSGTAWRCMFEPMSARLASSFSRNGMSAAATDTSCFGADTSMRCPVRRRHQEVDVARRRQTTSSSVKPLVRQLGVGLGDVVLRLLHGGEVDHLVGDLAVATLRYGVSMKPYLFTRAKVASELIRPMFGPSGVSIGQMRP
jgi:hypothetical protein